MDKRKIPNPDRECTDSIYWENILKMYDLDMSRGNPKIGKNEIPNKNRRIRFSIPKVVTQSGDGVQKEVFSKAGYPLFRTYGYSMPYGGTSVGLSFNETRRGSERRFHAYIGSSFDIETLEEIIFSRDTGKAAMHDSEDFPSHGSYVKAVMTRRRQKDKPTLDGEKRYFESLEREKYLQQIMTEFGS